MHYKLIRSKRRTLCLEIDKAQLIVRAPLFMSQKSIEKYINKKIKWVNKHLTRAKKFPQKQDHEILIFGNKYKIILKQNVEKINISGGRVFVPARNNKEAKEKINSFLLEKTKEKVMRYLSLHGEEFSLQDKRLIFKFYKSKWGSCSGKDTLSFNAALSMCSDEVVEYIVIHELAHLKHKNHSKIYWNEVAKYCPAHKDYRRWLRINRDMLKI